MNEDKPLMSTNECEGCNTWEIYNNSCPWYNETLICPCKKCLVKAMCDESCDMMLIYTSKVRELLEGDNH